MIGIVVEAAAWIVSSFVGWLPERPAWLRLLVALIYLALITAGVAAAISALT